MICIVHKYVDDTTLSEVLEAKVLNSHMMTFIESMINWANHNDIQN